MSAAWKKSAMEINISKKPFCLISFTSANIAEKKKYIFRCYPLSGSIRPNEKMKLRINGMKYKEEDRERDLGQEPKVGFHWD